MEQQQSIEWEYTIPFFSWYVLRIFVYIFLSPIVLLILVLFLTGGFNPFTIEDLTPDIYYAGGFYGLILLFSLGITFLLFPDGFHYKYIINHKGFYQIAGVRQKKVNMLVILLGILGRSATATGAGLLAYSGEERFIPWNEAKVIKINRRKKYIYINRGKIAIGPIGMFCTSSNFKDVLSVIDKNK